MIYRSTKKKTTMKRHIQDFNRFSVNEMSTEADGMGHMLPKAGAVHTWEFDLLIAEDPEMTYNLMRALEDNDVLMNIVTWHGPGGGSPVVGLTGTEEAVKNVFRQSMDRPGAEQIIEDMDEFGPVR